MELYVTKTIFSALILNTPGNTHKPTSRKKKKKKMPASQPHKYASPRRHPLKMISKRWHEPHPLGVFIQNAGINITRCDVFAVCFEVSRKSQATRRWGHGATGRCDSIVNPAPPRRHPPRPVSRSPPTPFHLSSEIYEVPADPQGIFLKKVISSAYSGRYQRVYVPGYKKTGHLQRNLRDTRGGIH